MKSKETLAGLGLTLALLSGSACSKGNEVSKHIDSTTTTEFVKRNYDQKIQSLAFRILSLGEKLGTTSESKPPYTTSVTTFSKDTDLIFNVQTSTPDNNPQNVNSIEIVEKWRGDDSPFAENFRITLTKMGDGKTWNSSCENNEAASNTGPSQVEQEVVYEGGKYERNSAKLADAILSLTIQASELVIEPLEASLAGEMPKITPYDVCTFNLGDG